MTKIAIITDTHLGVRSDSHIFANYQARFYDKVFFPTIDALGIDTILHLGDFFERRKYTQHESIYHAMKCFVEPIISRNMTMHLLVGNHDIALRNSNRINSPELFLSQYKDNIKCYANPQTIHIDGRLVHIVPWINQENFHDVMSFIEQAESSLLVGHFEITGFKMHPAGSPSESVLPVDVFRQQELVLSGHFHTQSKIANIHYIGNPFEFTWADYNDPRGFWILDTETLNMEFIRNPEPMFVMLAYDSDDAKSLKSANIDQYKDKFVKILVLNKSDQKEFDRWLEKFYTCGPFEVQVIETTQTLTGDITQEQLEASAKSTDVIISSYCDTIEELDDDTRKQVKDLLNQLYYEAINE